MRFLASLMASVLLAMPFAASAQQATTTYTLPEEFMRQLILPASYMQMFSPYVGDAEAVIMRLENALRSPTFTTAVPMAMATTSTSTQALIQTLLAQVATLQAQISAILAAQAASSTPVTPAEANPPAPALPAPTASSTATIACPIITRTLSYRANGIDVTNLQLFLAGEGLFETSSATGFFGKLTEVAVQAWQTAKALVTEGTPETTGYGAVGPKTRAALAACR